MDKVDVYNKLREKTGIVKEKNKLEAGEYRLSVHIWIRNSDGQILVEKRAKTEDKFPSLWAQVGGGVKSGETSKVAVIRECIEELNLNIKEEELFYVGSYTRTRDIVDIWTVNQEIDLNALVLQKEEVEKVKLVTLKEFDKMIEDNIVVPSINPSYMLFKNYCKNNKTNLYYNNTKDIFPNKLLEEFLRIKYKT